MSESTTEPPGRMKIGAVAKLAGISVHTLRKWEERYGAVEPGRTDGGGRVYTRDDLDRLILIKQLSDAGLPLRDVAPLPLAELRQLRERLPVAPAVRVTDDNLPVKTVIVGAGVSGLVLRAGARTAPLHLLACVERADQLPADVGQAEALVVECPTVRPGTAAQVRSLMTRLDVQACVVVYGFANRGDLLGLEGPGVATLRSPADLDALVQAVARVTRRSLVPAPGARDAAGRLADADVAPPRLSESAIAKLVASTPRVQCECPHHLADIVLALRAFETYSAECESANPADAALHRFLWRSAAQARALFEDAIERVAEAEGIDLGE